MKLDGTSKFTDTTKSLTFKKKMKRESVKNLLMKKEMNETNRNVEKLKKCQVYKRGNVGGRAFMLLTKNLLNNCFKKNKRKDLHN